MAEKKRDTKGQICSLIAMIFVYTLTNNVEKLKETASRIPVAASLKKDSWSRGVVLVSGLGQAVSEDQLKRGNLLSRLAGRVKLDPEWQMYYLLYSGILQYRLGNMVHARQLSPALQACRRYLALEAADEPVCRAAMEILLQTGQKKQALSLYQDLADFMAKEYNTAPVEETIRLYEKIRV